MKEKGKNIIGEDEGIVSKVKKLKTFENSEQTDFADEKELIKLIHKTENGEEDELEMEILISKLAFQDFISMMLFFISCYLNRSYFFHYVRQNLRHPSVDCIRQKTLKQVFVHVAVSKLSRKYTFQSRSNQLSLLFFAQSSKRSSKSAAKRSCLTALFSRPARTNS